MIINFNNVGGGSGSGSTPYVLPVATANRLGGIKVGSGLTCDSGGTLSVSGGTAPAGEGSYFDMYIDITDGASPQIYRPNEEDLDSVTGWKSESGYTLSLAIAGVEGQLDEYPIRVHYMYMDEETYVEVGPMQPTKIDTVNVNNINFDASGNPYVDYQFYANIPVPANGQYEVQWSDYEEKWIVMFYDDPVFNYYRAQMHSDTDYDQEGHPIADVRSDEGQFNKSAAGGSKTVMYDMSGIYNDYDPDDRALIDELEDYLDNGYRVVLHEVLSGTAHQHLYLDLTYINHNNQRKTADLYFQTMYGATRYSIHLVWTGDESYVDPNGSWEVSDMGTSEVANKNYQIVDNLPTTGSMPNEGQMRYAKPTSGLVEYEMFTLMEEYEPETQGWIGNENNDDPDYKLGIHFDSGNWYWDWQTDYTNDGEWRIRDWDGNLIYYKAYVDENDGTLSTFSVRFPEGSPLYVDLNGEASYSNLVPSAFTKWNYTHTVVCMNNLYTPIANPVYDWDEVNFVESADTVAFIDKVNSYTERGIYPHIYKDGHFYSLADKGSDMISFQTIYYYNMISNITFSKTTHDDNGFNSAGIRVDDTSFYSPPSECYNVGFGNDEKGGLTYDAENDYFTFDNNTIATGDTTDPYEDLADYNLIVNGLFTRNGMFEGGHVINSHTLEVVSGNSTTYYSCPTISKKAITPYTVDDRELSIEVTFYYTEWTLKMDIGEGNIGANLRIEPHMMI